jgi:hypothetical protein
VTRRYVLKISSNDENGTTEETIYEQKSFTPARCTPESIGKTADYITSSISPQQSRVTNVHAPIHRPPTTDEYSHFLRVAASQTEQPALTSRPATVAYEEQAQFLPEHQRHTQHRQTRQLQQQAMNLHRHETVTLKAEEIKTQISRR